MSRSHAVVLGGGFAGLLAARVLADEYAHVTIVERDPLPDAVEPRRGVPQGHHVHGLLPRGLSIVEQFEPGYTASLVAAGAHCGDLCANSRWHVAGGRLAQADAGLPAVSASRALIEGALRQRVRARANVSILDGHDVVGLASSAARRVTAVRVTSRDGLGSQLLPADLVVDATGRGSRTPLWLRQWGFAEPDCDTIGIDLTYRSRRFVAPPEIFGDDIVIVTARTPSQPRSAVMQRLEDGTVLVTLAGVIGVAPPAELSGFQEYAGSLAASDAYDVVRLGRPVDEPASFRLPTYLRRRYERLTSFPAGLLVLGDALCSFNPVYGQGLSVAAINAEILRDHLAGGDEPDPLAFFAAAARANDAPWALGVGSDLALPGVTGDPLPPSPLTGEYVGRLQRAAREDPDLAVAFLRVSSLVDPPTTWLRPDLQARVDAVTALLATG